MVVQVRDCTRQGRVVFLQGVDSLLNLIDGSAQGRDVVAQLCDLFTKGSDSCFEVVDVALDIVDFLVDFGLKVVNLLGYVGRKGINPGTQSRVSVLPCLLFVVNVRLEYSFCILSALRLSGNQAVQAIFLQSSAVDFICQVAGDFIFTGLCACDFLSNLLL